MHEDSAPRRLRALRPAWKTAKDIGRGNSYQDDPLGGWLAGELVVRADFDRLRAYDIGTGAVRWTWPVPDRDVLVAVSQDADDGIALVLHHDDGRFTRGQPTVTAVDLATGKQLWSRGHHGRRLDYYPSTPHTALSGRRIAWITEGHVESADPQDGAALWRSRLPGEAGNRDAWIMCVDPLVVVSTGHGRRGERRIFVLNDSGNVTASFALPAPYRKVELPAVVVNGMLVAKLVHPDDTSDDDERIGGFDLSTGKLCWERRPGGLSVQTLLPHRGQLLALHAFGGKVTALDARDGRVIARRRLRGSGAGLLRVAGDRFAVIGRSGSDYPVRVFHWR
ncbi:PQQ-like beta-propeller repeat protein [Streptomyces sp. NBC_01280]|uniref:outer membrane protein assembly factor BamB family protein n=1 Tax=unclassified Streptomyces TaxID=2593676 RepID=UPI002E36DD9A|nr:PQQ-binding-like beta-propeller repeat protein [Streptomyces sp. NBC_01280]WSE11971.1 PQQ-like beta-propeller repeat protein [Streptomyces sp. NBC_01397]WSE19655.1 PQQ-like beta-propeller repeat protein [Streptomyces sp. NBC_01397]